MVQEEETNLYISITTGKANFVNVFSVKFHFPSCGSKHKVMFCELWGVVITCLILQDARIKKQMKIEKKKKKKGSVFAVLGKWGQHSA